MIKAILFDFNGVIVDDEPLHMKAYQEVFSGRDIELTEEKYLALLGADDRTFVAETFRREGREFADDQVAEVRAAKAARYRELIAGDVPLFPGAENFVRSCANYFQLGIVSMALREEIEDILARTDLRHCFSFIISAENVDQPKPDPRCYKLGFSAMEKFRAGLGKGPMTDGECLAIEDSPPGVTAARGAALKTLAVTNTVAADALHAAGADIVTGTLEDWTPMSVESAFR